MWPEYHSGDWENPEQRYEAGEAQILHLSGLTPHQSPEYLPTSPASPSKPDMISQLERHQKPRKGCLKEVAFIKMKTIPHDGMCRNKEFKKKSVWFPVLQIQLRNHFHEHALNINIWIIIPFLVVIRRAMTVKKHVNIINLEYRPYPFYKNSNRSYIIHLCW